MDNNWLLAVLTLLKARMNLHWCFLAVILKNVFLWLKLFPVIVSRYLCDSQPSGACVMNLSLASSALPCCCTWGLHLCTPCFSGRDLHSLLELCFCRTPWVRSIWVFCLSSCALDSEMPVTTYLIHDQASYLSSLHQIPTLRMGLLTVTYHTGMMSISMSRHGMPSVQSSHELSGCSVLYLL